MACDDHIQLFNRWLTWPGRWTYALAAMVILASPSSLFAQQPCPCPEEPPPGNWVGSAGLGFSLNRGNTDTTNMNFTFDATYDPKEKDVWIFQGLYLRGDTEGEPTVDRLLLQGRYERNLSSRTFLFGQLPYLRDEFKEIEYLVAPNGGIGYRLIATERLALAVDGGVGVKWEKTLGSTSRHWP